MEEIIRKEYIALVVSTLLASCGTSQNLINELRLDECEVGEVDIQGQISTSAIPGFGGSLQVHIREERTPDTLPYHCIE